MKDGQGWAKDGQRMGFAGRMGIMKKEKGGWS